MSLARVIKVTEDEILFDTGDKITYSHEQDCCENNYADFLQVEDELYRETFECIRVVPVDKYGFILFPYLKNDYGIFIPCYSEQNGYYTSDISIYVNDKPVINFNCKEVIE